MIDRTVMVDLNWDIKRSLRIELLKIADAIQDLSIKYRGEGLDPQHAIDLNNLQIKVLELMGRLMSENPKGH